MKVLVAYLSSTGNTKKVAEAIYKEISADKVIKSIDDVDSIDGFDVTFLGFPVHAGGPTRKATKFLQKHCTKDRKIALFITHCALEDNEEIPSWLNKFRKAANGSEIIDIFNCQGELTRVLKLFMSIAPSSQMREGVKKINSEGQPDQTRLEKARVFSRNVMGKLTNKEN